MMISMTLKIGTINFIKIKYKIKFFYQIGKSNKNQTLQTKNSNIKISGLKDKIKLKKEFKNQMLEQVILKIKYNYLLKLKLVLELD